MKVDGRFAPPEKQQKSCNFGKFLCNSEKVYCFLVSPCKYLSFKLHKSLKIVIYYSIGVYLLTR